MCGMKLCIYKLYSKILKSIFVRSGRSIWMKSPNPFWWWGSVRAPELYKNWYLISQVALCVLVAWHPYVLVHLQSQSWHSSCFVRVELPVKRYVQICHCNGYSVHKFQYSKAFIRQCTDINHTSWQCQDKSNISWWVHVWRPHQSRMATITKATRECL